MQHKLLVLGSMDEFVDLVKTAQSKGIFTIVCDGYKDGPAKLVADKYFDIDVRNTEEIAEMCSREGVDGIITSFSDLLAECMVQIAHKAGLPCYSSPDRFCVLREKALMKKMFEELGIPTPDSRIVRKGSISDDLKDAAYPCVIKPANGYGSRGIYVVRTEEEIAERFDEVASFSAFDFILVEPYNPDFEINMMTWIVEGDPVIISMADREKSTELPHAIPHVSRIVYPSRFTAEAFERAKEIAGLIASYVGIETGPLSIQFFYSPERGIEVCEAAGRLFGYEHELVTYSCGLSIEKLLIDYVYDKDALKNTLKNHLPYFDRYSAGLYFHGYEEEIADVSSAQECSKLPGVLDTLVYYEPGDVVGHGVGAKPYVARYYIGANERGALDDLTKALYRDVRVLNTKGQSLLYKNEMMEY